MSETFNTKVEVSFLCSECNKELDVDARTDKWGDTTVFIEPCSCQKAIVEELKERIDDLEVVIDELKDGE
jgi:transcription initiation factor IIE alpha subunit